ncbi:hypothetical protein HUN23_19065, partial [Acinetobacter oleivorans]|nr:hypothetical protein [Acinetobacter oleivorans]
QHDPFVWVVRNQTIQKVKIRVIEQRYNDNIALVDGLQRTDLVVTPSAPLDASSTS